MFKQPLEPAVTPKMKKKYPDNQKYASIEVLQTRPSCIPLYLYILLPALDYYHLSPFSLPGDKRLQKAPRRRSFFLDILLFFLLLFLVLIELSSGAGLAGKSRLTDKSDGGRRSVPGTESTPESDQGEGDDRGEGMRVQ